MSELSGAATTSALPFLLEDYAGIATYRGKIIADHDRIIEQIDSGRTIQTGGNTISFGFLEKDHTLGVFNNPNYGFTQPNGYTPFSEAQKEATRESMALWDDLIPQDIIEKHGANGADILFANTTTGPAQAAAYYPGNGQKYKGDIWVATPEVNWTNDWLGFNGYGATTIIHEAGHALGLSHPGAYNFGPGFSVNYTNGAEYAQDSEQYSIMSYWGPQETGAQPVDVRLGLIGNAQTPLLHDILTIQAKYGADPTTRVGDTNYFSNSNAGKSVYDLSANNFPYLAVYDAGGVDTFDFSTANMGVFIDLRPGSFSSATIGSPTLASANAATIAFNNATDATQGDFALWTSQGEVDAYAAFIGGLGQSRLLSDTGIAGINATSHRNISIAYNTVIENANGGSARDLLVGNQVANILNGNGGNDVLSGLAGDDVLNGGAGSDMVSYMGATAGVNVSLANAGSHVTVEGSDTFVSIEGLSGSDFADILTGDAGANVLDGLRGNDVLSGGGGTDTFQFAPVSGHDRITDFVSGTDKIDLSLIDANTTAGATGNQAFAFIGNAAFTAAGQVRTYSEAGENFLAGDANGDGVADFTINLGMATALQTDLFL